MCRVSPASSGVDCHQRSSTKTIHKLLKGREALGPSNPFLLGLMTWAQDQLANTAATSWTRCQ